MSNSKIYSLSTKSHYLYHEFSEVLVYCAQDLPKHECVSVYTHLMHGVRALGNKIFSRGLLIYERKAKKKKIKSNL